MHCSQAQQYRGHRCRLFAGRCCGRGRLHRGPGCQGICTAVDNWRCEQSIGPLTCTLVQLLARLGNCLPHGFVGGGHGACRHYDRHGHPVAVGREKHHILPVRTCVYFCCVSCFAPHETTLTGVHQTTCIMPHLKQRLVALMYTSWHALVCNTHPLHARAPCGEEHQVTC